MMTREEKIFDLYFKHKLKQKDIASELGISKYIVSRTLNSNERYKMEKEKRTKEKKLIHKEKTKKYICNKREKEYAINQRLKQDHIQASIELSSGRIISNRAFRKWNASIYKFNPKKNYYEINKNITVSNDIPKIVK